MNNISKVSPQTGDGKSEPVFLSEYNVNIHGVTEVIKPCISKKWNVQEREKNSTT